MHSIYFIKLSFDNIHAKCVRYMHTDVYCIIKRVCVGPDKQIQGTCNFEGEATILLTFVETLVTLLPPQC